MYIVNSRCKTNGFPSIHTKFHPISVNFCPSSRYHFDTVWSQLNLVAPERFEGFLWRYPVLGFKPIHSLWKRWVHSLTVLNYAGGLRLCKDYVMIQRWIRLWSKVIEFGSWYPSQWRMESGEWFALFLGARLNIFTTGGIVYTSKVFFPKGPLMLGFNKVFYCLK